MKSWLFNTDMQYFSLFYDPPIFQPTYVHIHVQLIARHFIILVVRSLCCCQKKGSSTKTQLSLSIHLSIYICQPASQSVYVMCLLVFKGNEMNASYSYLKYLVEKLDICQDQNSNKTGKQAKSLEKT